MIRCGLVLPESQIDKRQVCTVNKHRNKWKHWRSYFQFLPTGRSLCIWLWRKFARLWVSLFTRRCTSSDIFLHSDTFKLKKRKINLKLWFLYEKDVDDLLESSSWRRDSSSSRLLIHHYIHLCGYLVHASVLVLKCAAYKLFLLMHTFLTLPWCDFVTFRGY